MNRCTKCGKEKYDSEFYKDKTKRNGLSSHCKECIKESRKDWRTSHPEKAKRYYREHVTEFRVAQRKRRSKQYEFIESLKTPCAKCGESRAYLIDFHHIEPSTKEFAIGKNTNLSKERLENEIAKCVCLCKNCHGEFHYLYGTQPDNPKEALLEYLGGEEHSLEL